MDLTLTFVVLSVFIALYSATGGFRSVVHTDVAQAILVFAGMAAGIYFIATSDFGRVQSSPGLPRMLSEVGWANAIGISFLGLGWLIVTMDTWQRNCASRNSEVSYLGIIFSCILMILSVIAFAYVGIYVKEVIEPFITVSGKASLLSSGAYPFNDLFLLESYVAPLLRSALGVVFLGLIMAGLSTADTFLVVLSHSLTTDVVLLQVFKKGIGSLAEKEQHLFGQIGRIIIVSVSLLVCLIWYLMKSFDLLFDPITLFFVFYSVQFALLGPILIGSFATHKDAGRARLSILASATFGLVVGLFFMVKLTAQSSTTYLLLRPDQWIALLPLVVFSTGVLVYFAAGSARSNAQGAAL